MKCHIMAPAEYLGVIMSLGMDKRGELLKTETMDAKRLLLTYRFPLNEIVTDFNDKLKSVTRGYGSFDYEFEKYEIGDISSLRSASTKNQSMPFPVLSTAPKQKAKGGPSAKSSSRSSRCNSSKCLSKQLSAAKSLPARPSAHHQKCHRQMLRRRYHPQTQALGKTKRRQKTDERDRQSQHPSVRLHGSPQSQRISPTPTQIGERIV